jgi:NADPH-dependent curcumin reductase CurA
MQSREIRLKSRPDGMPKPENFELATVDVAAPGAGEVQVKNLFMSVDPYMRGRMTDRPSYVPPFELGKAMQGGAVGEVTASNDPNFKPGDLVSTMLGWREAFIAAPAAAMLQKIETHGLPPQAFLGVAGMPGLTAYVGLLKIALMKDGETVFVSAAAGAVGQIVAQIAKIKGGTVVGTAGGKEKCEYLKSIGVDHVIDYKATKDLTAALAEAVPAGIDVYFDNVGGDHLEAALNAARPNARFALCGAISMYNDAVPPPGPSNLMLAVGKQIRLEGFIVSNHFDMMPAFVKDVAGWVQGGKLTWRETIDDGIEAAPGAFMKLFTGENMGKMLVKLG